jgi:hypothetical protein
MKKVFLVSLLLVSIFLFGSSGVALAQCMDYQDYGCTLYETEYGQTYDFSDTCVELCYDDDFEVIISSPCWFTGYLYPAPDYKHLAGTASTSVGWAGCSVESQGRSITAQLAYIQNGYGYVDKLKCTPCNDCCRP